MRRLRWAEEILNDLKAAGASASELTWMSLLKECNAIKIDETDGLTYLIIFFEQLFAKLAIDFRLFTLLQESHVAFFDSSQARVSLLKSEGSGFIGDIENWTHHLDDSRSQRGLSSTLCRLCIVRGYSAAFQ